MKRCKQLSSHKYGWHRHPQAYFLGSLRTWTCPFRLPCLPSVKDIRMSTATPVEGSTHSSSFGRFEKISDKFIERENKDTTTSNPVQGKSNTSLVLKAPPASSWRAGIDTHERCPSVWVKVASVWKHELKSSLHRVFTTIWKTWFTQSTQYTQK